jgi:hypothetical protein
VTVDSARDRPLLIAAEVSGHLNCFLRLPVVDDNGIRDRLRQKVDRRGSRRRSARLPPPPRFRLLPGALRVRTRIDAPGVAPAAVAPHGVGLASVALFRVLSGRPAR